MDINYFPGNLHCFVVIYLVPCYLQILVTIYKRIIKIVLLLGYRDYHSNVPNVILSGYEGVETAIEDLFQHTVDVLSNTTDNNCQGYSFS